VQEVDKVRSGITPQSVLSFQAALHREHKKSTTSTAHKSILHGASPSIQNMPLKPDDEQVLLGTVKSSDASAAAH